MSPQLASNKTRCILLVFSLWELQSGFRGRLAVSEPSKSPSYAFPAPLISFIWENMLRWHTKRNPETRIARYSPPWPRNFDTTGDYSFADSLLQPTSFTS